MANPSRPQQSADSLARPVRHRNDTNPAIRWLTTGAAILLATISGVLTIGTIGWQIPILGLIGSMGGYMPGWWALISLITAVFGVWAWRWRHMSRHSSAAKLAVTVGVIGIIAATWVIVEQSRTMQTAGVSVTARDFFGPNVSSAAPADETLSIRVPGGGPRPVSVYLPQAPASARGIIIDIHGGGWAMGDETTNALRDRLLTQRGYIVYAPGYSLATDTRPTWNIVPREIACTVAMATAHAKSSGADSSHVYLIGDSAGAQLATLVANRINSGTARAEWKVGRCGDLPRVNAVAVSIPAVNLSNIEDNPYAGVGTAAQRLTHNYLGGSPAAVPHRYEEATSSNALTRNAPPTLFLVGEADWLAPRGGAVEYAQKARAKGVEIHLIRFPWVGHFIWLHDGAERVLGATALEWFEAHR